MELKGKGIEREVKRRGEREKRNYLEQESGKAPSNTSPDSVGSPKGRYKVGEGVGGVGA